MDPYELVIGIEAKFVASFRVKHEALQIEYQLVWYHSVGNLDFRSFALPDGLPLVQINKLQPKHVSPLGICNLSIYRQGWRPRGQRGRQDAIKNAY